MIRHSLPCTRALRLVAAVALVAVFGGCRESGNPEFETPFAIQAPVTELRVGEELQLSVAGGDGTIAWSSTDAAVATVDFGRVAAVGSGTVTIVATSGADVARLMLTITRPPLIAPATTVASFGATVRAPVPPAQTIAVANAGDGSLTGLTVGGIEYSPAASGWLAATLNAPSAPTVLTLRPNTTNVPVGTHVATVLLASAVAANSPVRLTVTYVLEAAPAIALSAPTATFSAAPAGPAPAAQSIRVTNGGGGVLAGLALGAVTYAGGAAGWLSASLDGATAPATLTLRPAATALPVGTYTATVPVVSSTGAAPAEVRVTYVVALGPAIALGGTSVGFSAEPAGAIPAAQSVSIRNGGAGGEGALTGLAAAVEYVTGSGWLAVASPPAGTAPTAVGLRPTRTDLSPDTYRANVRITSPVAPNSPQTIAVTYAVQVRPRIALTPATLGFSTVFGDPAPGAQAVTVRNGGGGGETALTGLAASIEYVSGSGWLAVTSPPLGTAPTFVGLRPTRTDLAPDTYRADVRVTSPVAANSPQTVAVTYQVRPLTLSNVWPIMAAARAPGSRPCASCHTSSPDFTSEVAFRTTMINVDVKNTTACGGLTKRVVGGNPQQSCLWYFLNIRPGAHPGGVIVTLPASDTTKVRTWIQQGANP